MYKIECGDLDMILVEPEKQKTNDDKIKELYNNISLKLDKLLVILENRVMKLEKDRKI